MHSDENYDDLRQARPTNRECEDRGNGRATTTIIIIVIKIIIIFILILIRIIMITRPIQPTQSMRIMVVVKPSTTIIIIVIKIIIIKIITFIIIIILILIRIIIITRPIQPTQSMRIMVVDKPSTAAFRASPKLLIERYRCT